MDLSNGFLKDFTTVNRTGDVHLTYNQTEKKARLILPFTFKKLKVIKNVSKLLYCRLQKILENAFGLWNWIKTLQIQSYKNRKLKWCFRLHCSTCEYKVYSLHFTSFQVLEIFLKNRLPISWSQSPPSIKI